SHFRCRVRCLFISNMVTLSLPKTFVSLSSARISRRFSGFCKLCERMYSHILLTTWPRASGPEPTTAASSADGCSGFCSAFAVPALAFFSRVLVGIDLLQMLCGGIMPPFPTGFRRHVPGVIRSMTRVRSPGRGIDPYRKYVVQATRWRLGRGLLRAFTERMLVGAGALPFPFRSRGGTMSSNPLSSSGESDANLTFGGAPHEAGTTA